VTRNVGKRTTDLGDVVKHLLVGVVGHFVGVLSRVQRLVCLGGGDVVGSLEQTHVVAPCDDGTELAGWLSLCCRENRGPSAPAESADSSGQSPGSGCYWPGRSPKAIDPRGSRTSRLSSSGCGDAAVETSGGCRAGGRRGLDGSHERGHCRWARPAGRGGFRGASAWSVRRGRRWLAIAAQTVGPVLVAGVITGHELAARDQPAGFGHYGDHLAGRTVTHARAVTRL